MNNITFLNIDWLLPVIFSAILIWLIFIWKEWYVSKSKRFLLKSFLAFLSIGSLALIALKPVRLVEAEKNKALILTPGYNEEQLDSLQKETRNLKILRYEPGEPVLEEEDKITSAFILGHGISSFDLWQFDGISSSFLPGDRPDGVIKLRYKEKNSIGKSFIIQGKYNNPKNGNQLVLKGPGGSKLDSISLKDAKNQSFSLKTSLKAKGNFLYSLVEKDSLGNVLSLNPVPVRVADRQILKILILNAFPTFETKYLKNFLAESGHKVVVRSQLTRGRFKFEYFNTERLPVNSLSEEILANFDLLVIDANQLKNIGGTNYDNLHKAIREQGLGVFIQPDLSLFNASREFPEFDFTTNNNSEFRLKEWPNVPVKTYSFIIQDRFRFQPIHESESGILSGYTKLQNGRMGTSVFKNTYQLILDGNTAVYQALWSQLIEKLAKKKNPVIEWNSDSFMAYANEPFSFKVRTTIQDPEIIDNQQNEIPIKSNIDIPTLWEGTTFSREKGWQFLTATQDTTSGFYYYAGDKKDWSSLRAQETMQQNLRYFNSDLNSNQLQKVQEPINLFWFYIIFLCSIGFLWLEPKMSN